MSQPTFAMPAEESAAYELHTTSLSLLDRARAQDPLAWQRLVDLYGPHIYRLCRRAELQPADAADVTQEVFRAVAGNLLSFRRETDGDTFRGWLWTITRNKILDLHRRRQREPQGVGGSDVRVIEELVDELSATSDSGIPQFGELAHRALELVRVEFRPNTWNAFWKTTIEDKHPANVAEELGMSVQAVYTAKSRVLRRLRDELST